jgi:hypothetical protein
MQTDWPAFGSRMTSTAAVFNRKNENPFQRHALKATWVAEKRQSSWGSKHCSPMRGQDAKGHTVQSTSHAQWALPDARRRQHWAAHWGRLGAFKAGQLETRSVFCRSENGGEVASQADPRVQGTVPRYYGIVPVTNAGAIISDKVNSFWASVILEVSGYLRPFLASKTCNHPPIAIRRA